MTTCLMIYLLLAQTMIEERGAVISASATREIVFEVPGITCVGRFTESLQDNIVETTAGIHSVRFTYLSAEEAAARDAISPKPEPSGQIEFGGWGQLVFRVDSEFDDRILIESILRSKLYGSTNRWLLVTRKTLGQWELEHRE